jgi:hypothetical protein
MQSDERAVLEIGLGWILSLLLALAILAALALTAHGLAGTVSAQTSHEIRQAITPPDTDHLHFFFVAGALDGVYPDSDSDTTEIVMHDLLRPVLADRTSVVLCGEETSFRFRSVGHGPILLVYTRAAMRIKTGCRDLVAMYSIELPDGAGIGTEINN